MGKGTESSKGFPIVATSLVMGRTHSGKTFNKTCEKWKFAKMHLDPNKSLFIDDANVIAPFEEKQLISVRDMVQMIQKVDQWKTFIITCKKGTPMYRKHPTRKMRRDGQRLTELRPDHTVGLAAFPLQSPPVTSPPPVLEDRANSELNALVDEHISCFEDAVTEDALRKIMQMKTRMVTDWQHATGDVGSAHRTRARANRKDGELRLGLSEYKPAMRKIIKSGKTLFFPRNGKPHITEVDEIPDDEWGFCASKIREKAIHMDWPDKELISFLKYGFHDYSERTPPVSSMSPQQKTAMEHIDKFHEDIKEDMAKGWIQKEHTLFPSFIPFRIIPGSVVPKKQVDKWRVVWNASHPRPDGFSGAVFDEEAGLIPINSNIATQLPHYLSFEWTALESIALSIAILEPLARELDVPILGRTYDFSGWFRQMKMARTEGWKSNLMLNEGFHIDMRMQMGRAASAHSGQRLASLLAEILAQTAQEEQWGYDGFTEQQLQQIDSWKTQRRNIWSCSKQSRTIIFPVFQDDLTVLCLGQHVANEVHKKSTEILQYFEVDVSTKPEASKPFSSEFDSLGATFKLQPSGQWTCSPSRKSIEKFDEMLAEVQSWNDNLVELLRMQKIAGLFYFISKFVRNGRARCNEVFRLLSPIPGLNRPYTRVTKRLIEDMQTLAADVKSPRMNAKLILERRNKKSIRKEAFIYCAVGTIRASNAGYPDGYAFEVPQIPTLPNILR